MTDARAIVYGGSYGDDTLEKVNLYYTSPLQSAIYDWVADGLPLGPLSSWQSLVGEAALFADTGMPTVMDVAGKRAVVLDGVDDRMRVPYTLTAPHTITAVFRFPAPEAGDAVFYGYNGASSGAVLNGTSIATLAGYQSAGDTWIIPNPLIPADTNWHVALLVINGANSVLRIDGREVAGVFGNVDRDGMTLGFQSGGNGRANIMYRRITQFTGAASSSQRQAIVNGLAARYGIPQ